MHRPTTLPSSTAKFGGMEVSGARRLKALEDENGRLKRMLPDAILDNLALKGSPGKKVVTPAGHREAAAHLQSAHGWTLLRAIAQSRSWVDEILSGDADLDTIAIREGTSERQVRRAISLAFLAPTSCRLRSRERCHVTSA